MRSLCPPSLRKKFGGMFSQLSWSCCGHAILNGPGGMGTKAGVETLDFDSPGLHCFRVRSPIFHLVILGRSRAKTWSHPNLPISRGCLLNFPFITSCCSPSQLCVLPHSHQSGEHLAGWERRSVFPSGCQPLQTGRGFPHARGTGGPGHATDVRDHVPTCSLRLCVCLVLLSAPCSLLSFVPCCSVIGCSNRLTLIVQSGLVNQERKKENKLLIQCSLSRLRVCWNNGIINRTAVSSTLWGMSAGPSASPFRLSAKKPRPLTLLLLDCFLWNTLPVSLGRTWSPPVHPTPWFDVSGLCQAEGPPHALIAQEHHLRTKFYKQITAASSSQVHG